VPSSRAAGKHPPTWEPPHKWAAVEAHEPQPPAPEASFRRLPESRTSTLPFGASRLPYCWSTLFPSAALCVAFDKCSKHAEFVSCAERAATAKAQCSQLPVRPQLLGALNCHHSPGDSGHPCALCEHIAIFGNRNGTGYRLDADLGDTGTGTAMGTSAAIIQETKQGGKL